MISLLTLFPCCLFEFMAHPLGSRLQVPALAVDAAEATMRRLDTTQLQASQVGFWLPLIVQTTHHEFP